MSRKPTRPLPSHYLETLLLENLLQSQDNLETNILKSAKNDLGILLESLPGDVILQCIQTLFSKKGDFEYFDPITGLFSPNILSKLRSEGFYYIGQFFHTSKQYLAKHLKYVGSKNVGKISAIIKASGVEMPETHGSFGFYGDPINMVNRTLPDYFDQIIQGVEEVKLTAVVNHIKSELKRTIQTAQDDHIRQLIYKLYPNNSYFIPTTDLLAKRISKDAIKHLAYQGILFIGQLVHFSEKDMQKIRWFGPKKTEVFSRFLADEYHIFLKTGDEDRDKVFED